MTKELLENIAYNLQRIADALEEQKEEKPKKKLRDYPMHVPPRGVNLI